MEPKDAIGLSIILIFILVVIGRFIQIKKERAKEASTPPAPEEYDHFHRVDIAGGFILLRGTELERFNKETPERQQKIYHAQQKLIQSGQVKIAKYSGKLWLVGPLEYDRIKKDGMLENL